MFLTQNDLVLSVDYDASQNIDAEGVVMRCWWPMLRSKMRAVSDKTAVRKHCHRHASKHL